MKTAQVGGWVYKPRKAKDTGSQPGAGGSLRRVLSPSLIRFEPCQHLHLGLLACRTGRGELCCVCLACGVCCGSPQNQSGNSPP